MKKRKTIRLVAEEIIALFAFQRYSFQASKTQGTGEL